MSALSNGNCTTRSRVVKSPLQPEVDAFWPLSMPCIFCDIVAGKAPASLVFENDQILAFLTIQATRPGEALVIPKEHIDHFTDVPDDVAAHIMVIGQRLGRRMREALNPLRVGYVVHGFGIPHAHLIVLPLHDPSDITSGRFARHTDSGDLVFDLENVPPVPRGELDLMAERIQLPAE